MPENFISILGMCHGEISLGIGMDYYIGIEHGAKLMS
jgi:hypothetical protein